MFQRLKGFNSVPHEVHSMWRLKLAGTGLSLFWKLKCVSLRLGKNRSSHGYVNHLQSDDANDLQGEAQSHFIQLKELI